MVCAERLTFEKMSGASQHNKKRQDIAAGRRTKALQLRLDGATTTAIAEALGVTRSQAWKDLDAEQKLAAEERREMGDAIFDLEDRRLEDLRLQIRRRMAAPLPDRPAQYDEKGNEIVPYERGETAAEYADRWLRSASLLPKIHDRRMRLFQLTTAAAQEKIGSRLTADEVAGALSPLLVQMLREGGFSNQRTAYFMDMATYFLQEIVAMKMGIDPPPRPAELALDPPLTTEVEIVKTKDEKLGNGRRRNGRSPNGSPPKPKVKKAKPKKKKPPPKKKK